jgi:DNA modification methylase
MKPVTLIPALVVASVPVGRLQRHPRNARKHSPRQIRQLAAAITAVGFRVPILVDETGVILAGHARLEAALLLGLKAVPVIYSEGMSEAQKRIFMLADNRLAEGASWDRAQLAIEITELPAVLEPLGLDITITGFDAAEILELETDLGESAPDPLDTVTSPAKFPITRRGDLWQLGSHRVLCGDARSAADVDRLVGGRRIRLTFTDPPYNVPIAGHVQGKGQVKHPEFAFASGEMSSAQFTSFLQDALANVARVSMDGAIVYVCMDWRHIDELSAAGKAVFSAPLNIVVWNKTSPGQGSFYRSQHELIFVFKVGDAAQVNAFGLGKHGRTRSNVWTYPGANSFHRGRADELAMHPTVKPVALVADALKDCSLKGDDLSPKFPPFRSRVRGCRQAHPGGVSRFG